VGPEKVLDAPAQDGIAATSLVQKSGPFVRRLFQGLVEESFFVHGRLSRHMAYGPDRKSRGRDQ
jgi:hypothetical protein